MAELFSLVNYSNLPRFINAIMSIGGRVPYTPTIGADSCSLVRININAIIYKPSSHLKYKNHPISIYIYPFIRWYFSTQWDDALALPSTTWIPSAGSQFPGRASRQGEAGAPVVREAEAGPLRVPWFNGDQIWWLIMCIYIYIYDYMII